MPEPRVWIIVALTCGGLMQTPAIAGSAGTQTLQTLVAEAHEGSAAPALAAVRVRCSGPPETAIAGVARLDGNDQLDAGARFNIGSNAKSMLASLVAVYVQNGKLRWDSTLGSVLGPHFPDLHPELAQATVEHLLAHRSGLAGYASGQELARVRITGSTPTAQRSAFARQVLSLPPDYPPGSRFVYSNAGYIVVGVLLEHLSGKPFEQLMQHRVFRPLGIHATFSTPVPASPGQPWGHRSAADRHVVHTDTEPVIPAFLQPAGDVSLTMQDYGRYLQEHLCGLQGQPTRLLKPSTVQRLHQPHAPEGAGMGWGRYEMDGTPASVHVGGTGTFAAFVAILPARDLAVATVTNSGDSAARSTALTLLNRLVEAR